MGFIIQKLGEGNGQSISCLSKWLVLSIILITSEISLFWDTSTSSQVSNCDGVVLEIYLDPKFQCIQEVSTGSIEVSTGT